MRLNLKVPFAEKDEAKKLGARWDAARKIWYVDGKADSTPFARWSPSPAEASGSGPAAGKPLATPRLSAGKVVTGSDYVEQARVCECLPWDICTKCESTAIAS